MPPPENRYKAKISKIGKGSIGGKAEGLKRLSTLLSGNPDLHHKFGSVDLIIPETIVLATDAFDDFMSCNRLRTAAFQSDCDEKIAAVFLKAKMPKWVESELRAYLKDIGYPLAIRSSSLLEDSRFRAYAGLYHTYMLSNHHPDPEKRLSHLIQAIKLIYASTYFQSPKSFGVRVGHKTGEEKMAVIIQQVVGDRYGKYFYPAVSGVAQSYNYYPFAQMKPDEGVAIIAMGLGSIVVEGERALRFSPKYPQTLPWQGSVEDILENAQRYFYCIDMQQEFRPLTLVDNASLIRREVSDAIAEAPMQHLASTFIAEENRIRDTFQCPGHKVLTFANILKFDHFPLAPILSESLKLAQKEMTGSVEIEFSINLALDPPQQKSQFAFLQIRPMSARVEQAEVHISDTERAKAFCRSVQALGNTFKQDMHDIVYVRPDAFDARQTFKIAEEIKRINAKLVSVGRKYVLIGPGRWGSKDHWLGIPVTWQDISGVGAMVETYSHQIRSEPSQGSHFFHNISTIGINYITIGKTDEDFLNWEWLTSQTPAKTGKYVTHISFQNPMILKVDGRTFQCVIYV